MTPEEFKAAVAEVRNKILDIPDVELRALSSTDFEILVAETLKEVLGQEVNYEEGSARFPDIVFAPYGLEVKLTRSDSWTSTGNSILESTRVKAAEDVYIIFLKQGDEVDIRIKRYEECLTDIAVTHSPRYKINMGIQVGQTIFDKMGVDYDSFRQEDPIGIAKKYYQSIIEPGKQGLWWLDEQREEAVSPILKSFSRLGGNEKDILRAKLMALFPEILRSPQANYERAHLYILTKLNIYSKSFRDEFTSGGQITIIVEGNTISDVPKVMWHCIRLKAQILDFLTTANHDLLRECWGLEDDVEIDNPPAKWKRLVEDLRDSINGHSFSEVFDSGHLL